MFEFLIGGGVGFVGGLVVGWMFLPMPKVVQSYFIRWGWIDPNPKKV